MATYDSVSRTVPLLDVRGLHRSFYGIRALDGVDLAVEAGTITGKHVIRFKVDVA